MALVIGSKRLRAGCLIPGKSRLRDEDIRPLARGCLVTKLCTELDGDAYLRCSSTMSAWQPENVVVRIETNGQVSGFSETLRPMVVEKLLTYVDKNFLVLGYRMKTWTSDVKLREIRGWIF